MIDDDDQDGQEEEALIKVLVQMVHFTVPSFVPLSFELATHKTEEDVFRIVLMGFIDGKPHRYTATGKAGDDNKITLIGELVS